MITFSISGTQSLLSALCILCRGWEGGSHYSSPFFPLSSLERERERERERGWREEGREGGREREREDGEREREDGGRVPGVGTYPVSTILGTCIICNTLPKRTQTSKTKKISKKFRAMCRDGRGKQSR